MLRKRAVAMADDALSFVLCGRVAAAVDRPGGRLRFDHAEDGAGCRATPARACGGIEGFENCDHDEDIQLVRDEVVAVEAVSTHALPDRIDVRVDCGEIHERRGVQGVRVAPDILDRREIQDFPDAINPSDGARDGGEFSQVVGPERPAEIEGHHNGLVVAELRLEGAVARSAWVVGHQEAVDTRVDLYACRRRGQ
jgi:hypothetical protein